MRVALLAGESSGDALGAGLIAALKALRPDVEFVGIGGPQMCAEGMQSWYPQEWLAVRGYKEVLGAVPRLLRVRRELVQRLTADKPAVFIGIDAPDFNLGLERRLRASGVRTMHYVCPSLWAWRAERIKLIRRAVEQVLCVFPFERALLQGEGVNAAFVGHRLADHRAGRAERESIRQQLQVRGGPVFALLPGSRESEVAMHGRMLIDTARKLIERHPSAQFLVPLATRTTRRQFEQLLYDAQAQDLPMNLLYGHADWALTAADVGLVASGTASLEAALCECPHIVFYRVSPSTYRMVKRKLKLPWVGLPNILARRYVVPELLQDAATPDTLATVALNLFADEPLQDDMLNVFRALKSELAQGADERAATAVIEFVHGRGR